MPVTPEYQWSQTAEEVVIEVDIKGITKQKMDVFATDAMVKVVAHPYVLIIDLLEDVDADASAAYTQSGHVTFRLKKVCSFTYPSACVRSLLCDCLLFQATACYTRCRCSNQVLDCLQRDRSTWKRLKHDGSKAEREARRNESIEAAHAAAEEQRKAHVQRLKKSKTYGCSTLVLFSV